jgi:hypothetical protein
MKAMIVCQPSVIHGRNKKFLAGKHDGKRQRGEPKMTDD